MPEDPTQGLFFPGEATAQAAAQAAAAPPGAVRAPDPTLEAAAAARTRVKRSLFNRRLVIRWAGWGSLMLVVAGWANGFLSFFYPRKTGAFGGTITAGSVGEFKVGDVKAVPDGKFYVTRVPEGFIALWWKCPHLGCTVPWKENDPVMPQDAGFAEKGRFNCPCHGSIYDRYGQIVQGPAPRPMDRFALTVEGDKIRVKTGPSDAITRERAGPDAAVPA
jgi:cytochrome b6-f complex iron-sulfur subunit